MFKFIQLPPCPIVSFLNDTDTSFQVAGFLYNDGFTPVDPSDIGDICYATLEPRTERAELISFTIDSVTDNGVATITAVRGLSQKYPYGTGGASFSHQAGSNLVISNNPGLLNKFAVKDNDETITGNWTFNTAPTALSVTRAAEDILGNVKLSEDPSDSLGVATITIATPAVISNTGHGLIAGDSVKFTTTGALPTGLSTSSEYFVIESGLTADAFQVSTTVGGSAVNTSGSQSGVHTLFKTTPVVITTTDTRLLTQDENDAASGGDDFGEPSTDNKFLTEEFISSVGPLLTVGVSKKIATSVSFSDIAVSPFVETNIISTTLQGGLLSTNNAVRIRCLISNLSIQSSNTVTFRLKYGSTTVSTMLINSPSGAEENFSGVLEAALFGDADTSAQKGVTYLDVFKESDDPDFNANNFIRTISTGSSTEDSAGDLNLSLTVQFSSVSATNDFVPAGITVELLS